MAEKGKKYQESLDLIDRTKAYEIEEAIELVKQRAKASFDETVDAAYRLGVDPKKADQQIRCAMVLQHGTGKTKTVLVFAKGEKAKEAAAADYVADEDLIAKINEGCLDFDVIVATPGMMGEVGKLGRILGPKGLMPNPKTGTVTFEIEKAVKEIKAGKVEYRVDKDANVHVPIGKVSFDQEQLIENFEAITETIAKARPHSTKGVYLKNIAVSSTMGPGIKVDPSKYTRVKSD